MKTLQKICALVGACGLVLLVSFTNRENASSVTLDETPLAEAMETIEDEMRVLRKSLKDPAQNSASLTSIVAMQGAVAKAKILSPQMAGTQPAEKREAFVIDYRRTMIGMARQLLDLEELVLDGKNEEAGTLFKEIRRLEDSGHERFTEDG